MLHTLGALKSTLRAANNSLSARCYSIVRASSRNRFTNRFQSSSTWDAADDGNFDMCSSFTHAPEFGYIRQSAVDPVVLPFERIDQYVWKNLDRWQNKTAIFSGNTNRSVTYAELRDHCAALAVRLRCPKLGLKVRDVAAVCLPNGIEFPIATLGVIEAGMVVTSINPIYTSDEISKQLLQSKAKILIGSIEGHSVLKEAVEKAKLNIRIVCAKSSPEQSMPDGAIDLAELSDPTGISLTMLKDPLINPGELAFLPYSSGTTGLPKGVMLSHNNITANCEQMMVPYPTKTILQPTTEDFQDVVECVLPFFHIYGFTVLLATSLANGCKLVTLNRFEPELFLKTIAGHRASVVYMVPPIINFLANHPAAKTEHLGFFRTAFSGAAPISHGEVQRFMEKVNRPKAEFIQGYGLSETSPVTLTNMRGNTNYGSVGGLVPNTQAKIIDECDETMRGLPPGQMGELLVKGPQIMMGYLDNEEETSNMLLDDGWLRTGDVGMYDEKGYFFITDRLKELIKVKGFQVAPAELEGVLTSHPDIVDAAVVGKEDAISGEIPVAFVVRKPDSKVTEKEIQEYVAQQVAPFKKLEGGVRFIEAIPRNMTGKILRIKLREML